MERIELFDNYINNQLSDEQRSEFDSRLESDEEFASDFKVYLLTVNGICRESRQNDMDFGMAMRHLSKDQLYEIIGRKPKSISREDVANRLQSMVVIDRAQRVELSCAAALDDIDDDEYTDDSQDDYSTTAVNDKKKESNNSLRIFTFVLVAIMISLIIISIFW